jgi:sugar lactone lactonase YvrE
MKKIFQEDGSMLHQPRKRISFLRSVGAGILPLVMLFACRMANAQSKTLPEPVVASSTTTVGTGLSQPQGVGLDSAGDVFVASANSGSVVEFPVNRGASVTIMSGLSYNKGLTVDPSGNVYSTSYGGNISKWTAGGAANSGSTFTSGSSCPDFAAMGYYIGFYDLTSDAKGNIYALGGNDYILEFDQNANCTERLTPAQLSSPPGAVASDAAGDLYYTIGNTVYYLPVGSNTSSALAIPSGSFASLNALTVDANGDLLITDANSIDEIAMVNGTLQVSKVTYLVPAGAAFNIGISPSGVLYYGNFNANSVVRTVIGSLALGSSAVSTAGTAGVITYTFNAAVTPAAFNFVSGSAASQQFAAVAPASPSTTTCATGTAYAASTANSISFCTLNVALTPITAGKITGAVQLATASASLATTYLSGSGVGPGLAVDPGTQTSLGKFTTPTAMAVDGAGNVFVADSSANTVTEFAGSSTGVIVASGLNAPQGMVVDPAGNLFIADTGNNRVVEVPLTGGTLSPANQIVVASGLSGPLGLAVDLYGNILVANSIGATVVELPNQGGITGVLPSFTIGSGFKKPTAIAVDLNNDIFIADATAASIIEIAPISQQSTVLANYSQVSGLALDANDDIFITQTGVPSVTRIAFVSGAYATNATTTLGVGPTAPQGIAVDNSGNLYVADPGGSAAYQIQRTLGSLTFGKVNVGSSSAAQALTLSNFGTATLTFGTPLFSGTGNTGDFSVAASTNNGCATSLSTGVSCGVSATFSPSAAGTRTETLAFQSNAANGSSGATLTGTGANSVPTTLTLSVSPSGTLSFGQTITVTATVAPKTASSSTPTGTVQFSVDGSNYGAPVTLGSSGTATVSISSLSGGQHVINATYSGDNTFASSAATPPLTLTIATAATSTILTATVNGTTAVATGTSVTFTATVKPTGFNPPPYPSGSVTFYQAGNTTALGTAPLTNGVATFTTTALPHGQYNVTGVYSGDTDFSQSTSAGYAVYVSPPTFVLSNLPTMLSVPPQGSASLAFTITAIAGYTGTAIPTCSAGLPSNTVCSFSPGGVDFGVTPGAQNVVLTVHTGVPSAGFAGSTCWWPGILLLGAVLLFWKRRKLPRIALVILMLISGAAAASLSGCSNGSGSVATPAGSSTVTVQIAGSAAATGSQPISQSFQFTLQVQ